MDFGDYIKRLTAIDMQQIAVECLKSSEPFLLDANIDQLERGKTSKNEQIGKYANSGYADEKYAMNQRAGRGNVDLILTGGFKNGIFVNYSGDNMIFDSSQKRGDYGPDLLERYGDDVLGVFMTSDLKNDLQIDLISMIKKKL